LIYMAPRTGLEPVT